MSCYELLSSEADVSWQWKASLEEFVGKGWFLDSEADVRMLRRASLGGECCFGREWSWRGGCDGAERRFAVKEGRGLAWRSVWVTGLEWVVLWGLVCGGTAAGIYSLRLLHTKRCGRLGQGAVLALGCCQR